MLDNDRTGTKLQDLSPSTGVLSEDSGNRNATFRVQMDRLPKTDNPEGAPFDVDVAEGAPIFNLEYSGSAKKATRNRDFTSPVNVPGKDCPTTGNKLTCTVMFTVINDELYEGGRGTTEKVSIKLKGADWEDSDGITITGSDLSLTIEDNDMKPMLSVGDATATEGGKLTFEVTRTGAKENRLSVRAATAEHEDAANSATANSDYMTRPAEEQLLEFGKNELKQTFEIATTQDVIHEMDETLLVKLSMAKDTGGEPPPAIADDTGIGTITDNDAAPTALTISVDNDTIAEAADQTTVSVTATITSPTRFAADQTVTVTVGKEGDGAVEGTDYREVADTIAITIPATEASGNGKFDLTPVNDRFDDDDEKISVEGALAGMTVTHDAITIEDDDTRGITVSKATLTIEEADDTSTSDKEENEGTYEVALASQPEGGTVTINITNSGPTVATAEPSSLMFTAVNWESAQVVTMIAKDDTIDDTGNQKTTTITHMVSASDTDYADEGVDDVTVTVLDDDEAPTALTITVDTDTDTDDDQNTISEGAATPTVRITATLDGETQFATDKTITITVGDSDKDTATEGSGGDYNTVDDFDITLPAGMISVSHDLLLTLNDKDVVDEPDETVTVAGKLTGVTVTDTMFTIQDNDPTPTVTLVLTPASINESGAANASTVTATMDGESSEAVTLKVSATPVDPAVEGDLTLSENTTLTIPANTRASTGVVTIAAVDNDVDAANKTVTVAATATGGNALVQAPGSQTLTITDDDTRGITVSKATLTLDEEDNAATMEADEHQETYTMVLDSEPSGGTVTIGVASDDTNIAGVAPATLTFTASNWDEPQTVTVTAVLDGIDNPMDRREVAITHTVTATGTDYDGATASGVTVTVNDDDGAPTLSINSPSVTEADSSSTATLTFTVRLQPESGNTVTVSYADAGTGTATSGGTDYATLASDTLTFAPSETSKSVAVTVSGDDIDESDETVVVRLSSPSNATLTGGATTLDGTGTINDNDPTPTVSVADAAAVTEGDVAAPDPPNNMTFAVTLSAVSGLDVTVPYTLGGTATAGTDYTEPDPRSVTISAGTRQANIAIPVAGDEVDEENETIIVRLGTPTNATVSTAEGAGTATGTITDDDTRGVSVTPTELTVAEEDNAGTAATREDQETYKVVLTSQPTGAVTVDLNSDDESVARIDTASLVFDTNNWNTERMVTVTGQADVIDNTGDMRKVDISHTVSAAGTDYDSETAEDVAVTVTDDDDAPSGITLSVDTNGSTSGTPSTVAEDAGATVVTVTATVNGTTRYVDARTVAVSVADNTAASPADYAAVSGFNITIAAGAASHTGSFTVTPVDDDLDEQDETIDVTGTLSSVTITGATVTLTDNDDPVSFSIANAEATEGGKITFTVSRKGAGDNAASVKVTTATDSGDGVNAADADDYTAIATAQTLNFAKDITSQTVEVQTTQDDLFEPDETFRAVLSAPALGTGDPGTGVSIETGKGTAIGTIKNDDTEPSFAVADASATEGDAITFTVTRSGAQDNAVSVKWNTKADSSDGANAALAADYTPVTTAQTLSFAKGVSRQTFTVDTTEDVLDEDAETFLVELTGAVGATIATAEATGTITDDDDAPSGITLSVDTNGSTSGTPSTVAEDAGATVVTVTATVNGTTRYVDARTVAVSVADNTAASPADYAAVSGFNITIAAGAASHTGSFTVTPVDDDLDEQDETIDVTGTLSSVTITGATVTLTDNDDPVSFSIANAEATEGGKITFTVSRKGAGDNAASVKVTTATDSGDGVNAADADDYTAIATAQTLNFAKDITSQTVEVQTTQDDLFEPDETFRAVLSAPALGTGDPGTGVSIETGKGTAIGTIKNDDTEPSFAVADASATEGDAITFTVTRSGAQDNAVSVKWNTKADSSDGANAALAADYTPVTTAQTLSFAKGVSRQTFTVDTTEDVLDEDAETFLVELTGAVGATIATAEATGTINDDDDAPSGITLSVDTNGSTSGTPSTVAEDAGATVVTVTATVNGTTRYVDARTVAVSVADNTAASPADYAAVSGFNITIAAGAASHTGSFTVTPVDDDLDEQDETIDVTGTLSSVTITGATVTLTDNDDPVSFSIANAEATEGGKITFTVSRKGAGDNAASVKVTTATDSGDGVNAADADDYTAIATAQTLNFAKDITSQTVEVQTTQDDLFEPDETFRAVLSAPALGTGDPGTGVSIESGKGTAIGTIKNDDTEPSFAVADASATEGDAITFTVTRSGAQDNAVSVKWNTKADSSDGANAALAADYTPVTTAQTLSFAKGVSRQTFTVDTTEDVLDEDAETFLVELTGAVGATIATAEATGTINDDDDAPSGITLSVDTNGSTSGTPSTVAEDAGATVVTVTATVNGTTRYVDARTVAVSVADNTAASPADYAAVSGFNITIAAGAASHTGSFTVTPVDDDLDEQDETIDVTGTLSSVTITGATVTLTDNDDPVSFSIANAEATEGGKITFTVSRKGAGDNAASVKVTTATDSGDGVNAADADDYTAIATAQTLNFAKDITSQTVEVQTTQDDLFEPDETFRAVLSAPALGTGDPGTGVSIETGKGTAIGTIKNDDTEPSFAVADASATEGDAITFTVTRSGAQDNAVSVKWNTKADSSDGANAALAADYTPVTTAQTLSFAKGVSRQTFTVDTTEDVLDEDAETFLVELTGAVGATIATAEATGTINDDDDAPSGITLSVDTNGSTSGTPSTVAEDAGATVVTVTATVNGTTRYVDARTVAVSVADNTAASPADYAAVSGFNITIAAGAASHTGSFTVTPVDDDLDEQDETIDVTGTLSSVTITGATVTLTDNDDPVSFSIANAEATEGGKITFTVSRKGAGDNAASVKVTTATDSGDGVNAADADDYTAIATAQTLNFAKDITSQTVEVQTTQDDLFEPDETFRAVLSAPALGTGDPGTGVSIETGKGTAIGTIKNDDTEPSFAVADASATEGDAITFTVTRSGAMDNAVSVKWNTKADSSDGANAALAADYTPVTTAQTLSFAKGVSRQTFTVDTTEDVLDEDAETFLVELTEPVGAIISDAEATGTINDDDDAPSGITLSVDADTGTDGTQGSIAENGGAKTVRVTATITDTTRFVEAKTVTLEVGKSADSATEDTDYAEVTRKSITINAGAASGYVDFTLTPMDDTLHEGSETISLSGTLGDVTVTDATITLTDDDGAPTALTLSVDADTGTNNVQTTIAEDGGAKTVRVTATLGGSSTFTEAKTVTLEVGVAADSATEGTDYAEVTSRSITINAGAASGYVDFTLTPMDDTRHETSETISLDGTLDGVTVTDASLLLTDNDAAPTTLTLAVDADNDTQNVQNAIAENGGAKTVKVTATLGGATQFDVDKTLTLIVGKNTDSATEGTDYTDVADITLTIPAGDQEVEDTFTLTPTDDAFHEDSETISFDATLAGLTVTGASITLTSDDAAAAIALTVDVDSTTMGDQDTLAENAGATSVTVTATLSGDTRFGQNTDLTLIVGGDADSATEGTDYTDVTDQTITINANTQSASHTFTLTPTDDAFHEASETISLEGTLTGISVSGDTITLTSNDAAPAITLTVDADKDTDNVQDTLAENGGVKTVRVTATLDGTTRLEEAADLTLAVGKDGDSAVEGTDYTIVADQTITINADIASVTHDFTLTPANDDLHEGTETISLDGTLAGVTVTDTSLDITDDDAAPSGITLSVSPATVGEGAGETEITVTATVNGETRYVDDKTVTVSVGGGTAISGTDYDAVSSFDITIDAGDASKSGTFDIEPTDDALHEGAEMIDVTGTSGSLTITKATLTLTDDDGQPSFAVADASATEGDAITFTVTRSGAQDNAVSVKWNTKADSSDGANAALAADYTPVTTAQTLSFAKGVSRQTFTVDTTEDVLDEDAETFLVELTGAVGATIATAEATGTINDDDDAPSGITLSVDTNGSTSGTPSTVAEDAGATVVTVTATVNGTTRYVDARTVAVSVADNTAASPADYAAVSGFNITIAAGAASHTGSFTVTPVDDDLDEQDETIDVTGTLSSVTITGATVTLTDNDDPVSFSIANAEATEGGKITFTVSRKGAGDNAASVKVTTATDSGDGVNAADADDYTAIATAQTLNFAKDITSQTVEVQTTQDDLFEPDETFRAVLSAPALGTGDPGTGVSIETGKGTAIGTIKNDDTEPSFAVADASATEGDAITFTVTRSGAQDNAVSVKWNTKADSSDGANAALAADYTPVTTAQTLSFAKGVSRQTFTVDTTEDVLDEDAETFLVELTGAVGAIISDAEATGTINDDDDAPSGITLSVDADTGTDGTQGSIAENGGAKTVRVTATLGGSSTFTEAKTVTVEVGADADSAEDGTDYATVAQQSITIDAGAASGYVEFTLTPANDDLHEGTETISLDGTLAGVTVTDTSLDITDDDAAPSGITLSVSPATVGEGAGETEITVTATVNGETRYVDDKTVTVSVGGGTAISGTDYDAVSSFDITIDAGDASKSGTFDIEPTDDALHEGAEMIDVTGTSGSLTITKATLTLTDDDGQPSFAVADASATEGDAITFTVTRSGAQDNAVSVKWNTKADSSDGANAALAADYTPVTTAQTLSFAKGVSRQTFTVDTTEDVLDEDAETFLVELTGAVGATIATAEATGTINDDDDAPSGITLSVDTNGSTSGTPSTVAEDAGATVVTVTATVNGTTRYVDARTVAVSVADNTAASPADYAAVSGFNITIAAGAASHTGSFTVTPVDDDLDEQDETIDVTGTLSSVTITGATVTLTDNDDPVSFSIANAEATEGGKITFTVSRKGAGDNAASVKVTTATDSGDGVNAADADDYTAIATAQTLNFAKDITSQTVEVQTTQDDLFEPDETFRAVLSAPALGTGDPGTGVSIESGKGTAIGTIKNDDTEPSFAVADASATEGDAITFTVTRSGAQDNAVSVKWNTKADSSDGANAALAADYTPVTTAQTLSFAKGVSRQTFTVDTTEDVLDEDAETFLVELTEPVGAIISDAEATGTINDDDDAPSGITLSVDADTGTDGTQGSIAENGGAKTVRVTATLGGSSTFTEAKTVTVEVGADADSAEDGTDYATVAQQSITIDAGAASGYVEFTLTPANDDLHEGTETISLDGTLAGVTVTDTSLDITDDDAAPSGITLSVSPATVGEGAGETEITVTATVNGETRYVDDKTVTVSVGGGTAISGTDYDAVSSFDITIDAGDASKSGTFDIEPTDDALHEGAEMIDVTGTSGSLTITKATLTLTDDDGQPSFAVADASATEGDAITFTVTRSGAQDNAVSVKWNTKADSSDGANAALAADYTPVTTAQTLSFAKGVSRQTFTVDTTEDVLDEDAETFLVELTGAVGATIATAEATGTITDDDDAPSGITLSVDADTGTDGTQGSIAENGGAKTVRVTATLGGSSTFTEAKTVTVEVGADADSAEDGTDYATVAQQSITIDAGAASGYVEFTLTPANDDLHEGTETISLDGTLAGVTVTDTSLDITDDENTPTVTLELTPATINESGSTNTSTVTATLSGKSSIAVTLTVVAAAAGANTVAGDFTVSTNKTLKIVAGATTSTGTVTITAVDNYVDAPNKSVTVSATATGGFSGVANPESRILTITDDDDVAPTVTLVLTPTTINESGDGNASTVTATLSGESSAAVTVTVAAAAGADTVASDFTLSTTTLTIAAGAKTSTGTVTITAVDNDVDAPNKSVTVSATASGGGVADPGNQTLTITDDDVAPTGITLSVSPATVGEGDDETEITVTATVNGTTRYVDAKTVTVSVGGGDAISGTDYTAVPSFDIIIAAGEASKAGTFDLTPTDDVVHEGTEKIDINGTLSGVTITKATITLTDDDAAPTALTLSVDADMGTPGAQTSLEEDGGAKKVRVTATLDGRSAFTETKTVTLEVGADADSATEGTDYAEVERQSITINAGAESGYVEFTLTPTQDVLHEGSEAISLDGTLTGVTVTDSKIMLNDDDGAPTALTLSVDADTGTDGTQTTIAEDGGAKTVRVTATITGETRFVETKTVTLEVGADADSATEGTDYAEVMRRSVTINAGAASGYEEFTLTPTDDTRHEGSETISLEGTLTDVAVTGTSITITDEEDTPTVTLMLAPTTISESGSTNTSTVTATLSGESSSAVTVTVAAAAGAGTAAGDFTVSTNKTLTIAAGATTSTGAVTITAVDNNVDAPNKSVTVSATASGGGVASPADQTLVITDDDAAPTGITLSVSPATVGEGDGETEITVTATVNGSTRYVDAKTVTVSVGGGTAISGTDYAAVPSFDITIAAGDASKAGTFDLEPTDDAVHEENETIDVTGSSGSLTITKASITITDNDDRSDPMLAAWLGRFGRGVAEQALDGIAGRIAASRSAGMQGTVAGKALVLDNPGPTPWNFGAGRSFGHMARTDTAISFDADSGSNPSNPVAMTAREVLLGSSFTATGETATGGSLALWGRTAQSSFDGQDGDFSLDGETTSAMLGADYARDGWLLGLALMQSSGKGGYSDSQARPCPAGTAGQSPCGETVRQGGGTVKATMTAVLPYASLQVSERLRLWGALGHGSGEVTLRPEPGGTLSADISWSMAATGLRGDVITAGQGSNFSLAFTSDMLWSRTRSEKTHELAASSATVTRLRAGLEAGWQMPLEHGSWLTPRLEIGARHDGGDAETGLGVELGGGLAWTDPGRGLSLDLSARTLIVHDDDDIKDQGFAATFSFDPQPDSARGLSLSLRQDAGGQPEGGLNALFTPEPLSARSGTSGSNHSAEAAYGLPALSGRFTFTPHVGLSLAEESRDFRFGWRLTPEATAAPDLSIGLVATRRESAAARPVHGVGLGMTFRW